MSETRPSGIPVIDSRSAVLVQELAEIDGRSRLHLLPRWAKRVDWLPVPAKHDVDALIVFVEPGLVSLRAWEIDGPRILQRYADIAEEIDTSAQETLRLIEDRYRRLVISTERRPHLGDAVLAHLGIPIERGRKSTVYVVVFPDRIDLLAPEYRNAKLIVGDARIDDLP